MTTQFALSLPRFGPILRPLVRPPNLKRHGQVPRWSNTFTQPIISRIEMLSTGVRADIGVKVFGPDLETIDRVCKQVEAAIKPINGSRDVVHAIGLVSPHSARPDWNMSEPISTFS